MRIRTVKPDFMKHEQLQDLEIENPGMYIMMTFQGLWMLCDNKGRFEYKPRLMKLEILPFIPFDLQITLNILEKNGYFKRYEVDGKFYGYIPTFLDHQRITGKEADTGEKYPEPIETTGKQEGNTRETPGKHPDVQEGELGKGIGRELGNGRGKEFEENKKVFPPPNENSDQTLKTEGKKEERKKVAPKKESLWIKVLQECGFVPEDPKWAEYWENLCEMPKWRTKPEISLQSSFKKLIQFDEEFSIMLMDAAIEGNYQGVVFPDTKQKYQDYLSKKNNVNTGSNVSRSRFEHNKNAVDQAIHNLKIIRNGNSGIP